MCAVHSPLPRYELMWRSQTPQQSVAMQVVGAADHIGEQIAARIGFSVKPSQKRLGDTSSSCCRTPDERLAVSGNACPYLPASRKRLKGREFGDERQGRNTCVKGQRRLQVSGMHQNTEVSQIGQKLPGLVWWHPLLSLFLPTGCVLRSRREDRK